MKTAFDSTQTESSMKLVHRFFIFLVVMAVALNILAPILALSWAKQPFLGTFFYPNLIVSDSYNPEWAARQGNLHLADWLQSVDNHPLHAGRDLYLLLQQKQVGDSITLNIIDHQTNAAENVTVTLTPFSLQDLLIFFWLPYFIGLVHLTLSFIIYYQLGIDRVSISFINFGLFVAIFTAGLFDQHTTHFLTPVWAIAFPFIGAAILHLALTFPMENRTARHNRLLYVTPYLFSLILGLGYLYGIYFATNHDLARLGWWWIFSFIGLSMVIFLGRLIRTYLSTISPIIRQQTVIAFFGSLISFTPVAVWVSLNVFGQNVPFSWPIFVFIFIPLIIFPLTMAYASLRYWLPDLDLIFSQTGLYIASTTIVTIIYIGTIGTLSIVLQDNQLFRDPTVLTIFIIALVIVLGPVRVRLQNLVNQHFLRSSIDYRQMLQNYGRELIAMPLSTDNILQLAVKHARNALIAEPIMAFLRNMEVDAFACHYQEGLNHSHVEVHFGLSDDLAKWLADTNDILQLGPNGMPTSNARINREELARLNVFHIGLCVPLFGSKHLLGWLALGLKKSGQPYNNDDLLFLATMASQTTIALENAQLLKEAKRRAAELEALQQISVTVQSQVEFAPILKSVVEQASKLLQVEGGMVWLLQPDEETLKVVVSHNLEKDYTNFTLKKSEGVAGRVLLLDEPVAVDNHQTFSGRSAKFQDHTFGATLGVPLRWSGKVRGVLSLVHRPGHLRFSESDIWLMRLFASQSAIAIEKSYLLEEAKRRANQLAMLSNVSMAISSTLNLSIVLPRVMESAVQILDAEAGSLFLVDSTRTKLTFEVVLGPSGKHLVGTKIPIGVGIVGTVANTSKPLIINNVAADPRWHTGTDKETKFHTRDILCVPMLANEKVVGVIEVINKKNEVAFTSEDETLLLSFAVQAAIVIENAQMFTRIDTSLASKVQELQTLQMFDHELQRSLELERVLDITLTRAMDALGVDIGAMGIFTKQNRDGFFIPVQYGMGSNIHKYKTELWPITQGVIGRVARTGKAEFINNVHADPDYIRKSRSTESMIVIPIIRDDQVVGIIDLESTSEDYFTKDDLIFVQLLASHAAIALDNAQLFEQVKTANEAKSQFMNTASHDLKVPMTSIKGYAKMLQIGAAGALNDQQKEFVKIIYGNIDRMDRLVLDLLDVSRIEAGRIRLELRDVQVADMVDDVLTSVHNQIAERELKLHVDVPKTLPKLRADYHRLVQVTTNLVSNAYKYTPNGGQVTIKADLATMRDGEEGIYIMVKDSGYGISKEDQAKLFTNFFRSTDQNIRNQPGTGLGLSITKKMIESHGGTLQFESELGQGTTFTMSLPLISKIPPGVEVSER